MSLTALKMYKFIKNNGVEVNASGDDVYACINYSVLGEFMAMLTPGQFDDGASIPIEGKQDYAIVELNGICEYYGFQAKELLDD